MINRVDVRFTQEQLDQFMNALNENMNVDDDNQASSSNNNGGSSNNNRKINRDITQYYTVVIDDFTNSPYIVGNENNEKFASSINIQFPSGGATEVTPINIDGFSIKQKFVNPEDISDVDSEETLVNLNLMTEYDVGDTVELEPGQALVVEVDDEETKESKFANIVNKVSNAGSKVIEMGKKTLGFIYDNRKPIMDLASLGLSIYNATKGNELPPIFDGQPHPSIEGSTVDNLRAITYIPTTPIIEEINESVNELGRGPAERYLLNEKGLMKINNNRDAVDAVVNNIYTGMSYNYFNLNK